MLLLHRADRESWTRDFIFFRRVNFLGILSPAGPRTARSSARADGSSGSAAFKTVGLTRRAPPTCRHRREWLRLSESALSGTFHLLSGRVPPPGEPVNVRRTVDTKSNVPTFLGATRSHLIRLRSRRERPTFHGLGRPRRVSPTAHHLSFKNQNSTNINRQVILCHADGDKSAGRGDPALPGALPVTWSKLVSQAPNFTYPLIYSIPLGPTALNLAVIRIRMVVSL
jgi:hypothetical protein